MDIEPGDKTGRSEAVRWKLSTKSNSTTILITEADMPSCSDDVSDFCSPSEEDETLARIPKLRRCPDVWIQNAKSPRSSDRDLPDAVLGLSQTDERVPNRYNRSGGDNVEWEVNKDVLNSSSPQNVDKSRLATDPNVFIQESNDGGASSEYSPTCEAPKSTRMVNVSDQNFNRSSSSQTFKPPNNEDRLVATPGDDEDYENLFNNSPNEIRCRKKSRTSSPKPSLPAWHTVFVFVRMIFLKIGRINTLEETFEADVYIEASWRETELDGKHLPSGEVDWENMWQPRLYVVNVADVQPRQQTWRRILYNKRHQATIIERRRVSATFTENMELHDFPFDSQSLSVTLSSERSATDVELKKDDDRRSYININEFTHSQEWCLHDVVSMSSATISQSYSTESGSHFTLSGSCSVSRHSGFFVWNYFVLIMILSFLSFTTFVVNSTLPQNRLFLVVILFLATINFKMIISKTLPKVHYLTCLDKYTLVSLTTIGSVGLWHSFVVLVPNNSLGGTTITMLDRLILTLLLGGWLLFQAGFFLHVHFKNKSKKTKKSLSP